MHEVSLMRGLIRQVEEIVDRERGGQVTEVRVSIGPLSGVEPALIESAFHQLAPDSSLASAHLAIELTQLTATCRQCDQPFVVHSFVFQCPDCLSHSVRVTSGDEFRLVSISVEEQLSESPKEATT